METMLDALDNREGFRRAVIVLLEAVCDNREDTRGRARVRRRAENIFVSLVKAARWKKGLKSEAAVSFTSPLFDDARRRNKENFKSGKSTSKTRRRFRRHDAITSTIFATVNWTATPKWIILVVHFYTDKIILAIHQTAGA